LPYLQWLECRQLLFSYKQRLVILCRCEFLGWKFAFVFCGLDKEGNGQFGFMPVVAFCGTLLFAVTGENRRINIQCKIVEFKIVEKPAVQTAKNCVAGGNIKLPEVSLKCFVFRHTFPSVQSLKAVIQTCNV